MLPILKPSLKLQALWFVLLDRQQPLAHPSVRPRASLPASLQPSAATRPKARLSLGGKTLTSEEVLQLQREEKAAAAAKKEAAAAKKEAATAKKQADAAKKQAAAEKRAATAAAKLVRAAEANGGAGTATGEVPVAQEQSAAPSAQGPQQRAASEIHPTPCRGSSAKIYCYPHFQCCLVSFSRIFVVCLRPDMPGQPKCF